MKKTMDDIKTYAEMQTACLDDKDIVGFNFQGSFITNPWLDPTGRFPLSTDEAFDKYGELNMSCFINDVSDILSFDGSGLDKQEVTLETTLDTKENGKVKIWRYGINDYSLCFSDENRSVRGTLEEIIDEISQIPATEESRDGKLECIGSIGPINCWDGMIVAEADETKEILRKMPEPAGYPVYASYIPCEDRSCTVKTYFCAAQNGKIVYVFTEKDAKPRISVNA